ncbi:hypothetical protein HG530_007078 [Fusarium avenaceum]|nr:hypothetical protein HG530_007078 [Fusarium avenaceum]
MPELSDVDHDVPERWAGCETCRAIWQRLTSKRTFASDISLGSFDEALSTSCLHHRPLLQAFYDFTGYQDKESHDASTSKDVGLLSREGHHLELTESVSSLGYYWNVALVNDNSIPNHPGIVRVLDPDWVDLDILKQWKDTCISSHGVVCHNPLKVWHARPAWLIDVERECLVPGSFEGNYVALSYTYGDHIGRLIDVAVREKLQVSHAFRDPTLSDYVPPILRNATYLTSVIGERYLWVDAICIPHENKESTIDELRIMGAIYANAIVTIVAADGDTLTGLAGLKGISEPRQLKQEIVPFGDEKLLRRDNHGVEPETWRPYYERGWIFQELRLSTRKIIFQNEKLHWKCQCSSWFEETMPGIEAELRYNLDNQLKVLLAGYLDWGIFALLVSRYNNLSLRCGEDALPAISGYLSILSRVFEGGFLYGIPEMLFERGLGPYDTQLIPSGLPSWSWLGWKGSVHPGYNEAIRVGGGETIEESTPITEWYTSRSPDDPPDRWRRIKTTWYEKRDIYKDLTRPLPPGWVRHNAPGDTPEENGPHLHPDGCEKYVFQHESLPHENVATSTMGSRNWYYPFTVPEIDGSTQPDMPEQTEYLFCKTDKAQLLGFRMDNKGNDVILYNIDHKKIGFLNLNNADFARRFPEPLKEDENGEGLPVELVAVCKQYTYLVLWVEWEDGIAYRLASGHVFVEEWDKLDLEAVSLVIG